MAIAQLVEAMVLSASAISQKAAEAACNLAPSVVTDMRDAYWRRARLVIDVLGSAGLLAQCPRERSTRS